MMLYLIPMKIYLAACYLNRPFDDQRRLDLGIEVVLVNVGTTSRHSNVNGVLPNTEDH